MKKYSLNGQTCGQTYVKMALHLKQDTKLASQNQCEQTSSVAPSLDFKGGTSLMLCPPSVPPASIRSHATDSPGLHPDRTLPTKPARWLIFPNLGKPCRYTLPLPCDSAELHAGPCQLNRQAASKSSMAMLAASSCLCQLHLPYSEVNPASH